MSKKEAVMALINYIDPPIELRDQMIKKAMKVHTEKSAEKRLEVIKNKSLKV